MGGGDGLKVCTLFGIVNQEIRVPDPGDQFPIQNVNMHLEL